MGTRHHAGAPTSPRATPADIEEATRGWADAHNLFLETAVTSGVLGLIPLVALFVLLVGRAWRAGPERAWSLGAAAALGAYAMVEPLNLVLTPLLFLFAAMAAGLRAREPDSLMSEPREACASRSGSS